MGAKEEQIARIKRLEQISRIKALEMANAEASEADFSTAEIAGRAGRNLAEGATFGISEPVMSGAGAAIDNVMGAVKNAKDPGEFFDQATDLDKYMANYDADVNRQREFEDTYPYLSGGSEMVGAVAPAFFTGGASALASGARGINAAGKVAAKIGGKFVPQVLKTGGAVRGALARVAEGAVRAGTEGLISEGIKQGVQRNTGFIQEQDNYPSITETALLSAGLGGAVKGADELMGLAKWGGQKALDVFTQVKPEDQAAYLANEGAAAKRINDPNSLVSMENVKGAVDKTVGKFRNEVDLAKEGVAEAKDKLKLEQTEAREKLVSANQNLDHSFRIKDDQIKKARIPLDTSDILNSVEQVKRQVSDLSNESYKILSQHPEKFKLKNLGGTVDELQESLKTRGELLSEDSVAAYNVLDTWKSKLGSLDQAAVDGVSAPEVKKIIQELDSDLRKYSDKLAGGYSDLSFNKLMKVREALDSQIKDQVPGYREIMKETQQLTKLRAEFSKLFGKRQSVDSKLAQAHNPLKQYDVEKLKELGQITGKDFTTPLDEYISLKNLGKTALDRDSLRASLPEYIETQRAQMKYDDLKNPQMIEERLAGPQQALAQAQDVYSQFSKFSEANSENMIKTLMGDKRSKLHAQEIMKALGDVSDQQFEQMINDLRLKGQFEKTITQGSRNTLLWTALMSGIGSFFGGPVGAAAGLAGPTIGATMDRYGPRVAKKLLDGVIKIQGLPAIKKINTVLAELPPQLKDDLRQDLIRSVTVATTSGKIVIPQDQLQDIAKDIKDSDMGAVAKAQALNELHETQTLDSKTARTIMIGEEQATEMPPQELEQEPQKKLVPNLENVSDFVRDRKEPAY